MKPKYILAATLVLNSVLSHAQEVIATKTFPFLKDRNLTVNLVKHSNSFYTVQCDSILDFSKEFNFRNDLKDPVTFQNDLGTFFKNAINIGLNGDSLKSVTESKYSEIFYALQSAATIYDGLDKPTIAGTIHFSCGTNLILTGSAIDIKDKNIARYIKFSAIQVEFNGGFMENILVTANLDDNIYDNKGNTLFRKGTILKFENFAPLGFSSKREFSYLKYYFLYEQNHGLGRIKLEQLLTYIQSHNLNGRDFSPKDGVENFEPCETRQLFKELTSKLIELKIYSDFVGLDQDKPNGLVQLELQKRINVNTYRYPGRWNTNFGFFNFLIPSFSLTKIEQNNRRLVLNTNDTIINNSLIERKRYATTLDIKNHETYSVGVKSNLIIYDVPQYKFSLELNLGLAFSRTLFTDSLKQIDNGAISNTGLVNEGGINSFSYYPEISIDFKPDERYGVTFCYSYNIYKSQSSMFDQVDDIDTYLDNPNKNFNNAFGTLEVKAYVKPSPNSTLFFRYRYNYITKYSSNNFEQIQLGYSIFLLKVNKPANKN